MDRKKYREYLKVLELSPDASLAEIESAHHHLKKLYSPESEDSIALAPLEGELSEDRKRNILEEIEEAYAGLMGMIESESKRVLAHMRAEEAPALEDRDVSDLQSFEDHVAHEIGAVFRGRDLIKSFNRRPVVNGIDIEVRSGEIIGLLGRNGAGKTTTFLMMAGLLRPDSGLITLDDRDISGFPANRRAEIGITYLPQENSVFLKASVANNLKMILELRERDRKVRKASIERLLADLGLSELSRQRAHSLSGGERRRLEICRSLILKPRFLLLDEPFTGIDPITIIELQRIILRLRHRGMGIILSDHNVRDTLRITDRAYVIDEGELLVEGSPREIAADDRARERFLGRNFKLGGEVALYSS